MKRTVTEVWMLPKHGIMIQNLCNSRLSIAYITPWRKHNVGQEGDFWPQSPWLWTRYTVSTWEATVKGRVSKLSLLLVLWSRNRFVNCKITVAAQHCLYAWCIYSSLLLFIGNTYFLKTLWSKWLLHAGRRNISLFFFFLNLLFTTALRLDESR